MRKIYLLAIIAIIAIGMQAKQVDKTKAKSFAQQFMNAGIATRGASGELQLVYTATSANSNQTTRSSEANNNLFYVFNQSGAKGFVIVAADDAVKPILAYSYKNTFNADDIPCNVKALLDTYRSAISTAIANGDDASSQWQAGTTRAADATEGDFLIKTQWSQHYPYNAQTPMLGGSHCVTGCVATAMAQVMNYWKYPLRGTGSHSYYWPGGDKTLSADFTEPFDWDNMKDTYSYDEPITADEEQAISHLMLQCGISLDMSYYDQSGARTTTLMNSLVKYFGYSEENIKTNYLDYAGQTEWLKTIKAEIDGGRPVVYSSNSHCYICDGYNSDDYLHINFGWGGYDDGFYALMGTNEYLNKTSQNIVYGIVPTDKASTIAKPDLQLGIEDFICNESVTTFSTGQSARCYINMTANRNDANIEALALVSVDANNSILAVLGHESLPSVYDYADGLTHYSATVHAIALKNTGTESSNITVMPACKINGSWTVVTSATPLTFNIEPLKSTDKATKLNSSLYAPATQAKRSGTCQLAFKPRNSNSTFVGTLLVNIKDPNGNIVREDTYGAVFSRDNSNWARFYYYINFETPGEYTLSVKAYDESNNEVELSNTENKFTITTEPAETYLTAFGIDTSGMGEMEKTYSAYLTFAPGGTIKVKGSLRNPTSEDVTKTYVLARDEKGKDILKTMEVNIPANSNYDFSSELTANTQIGNENYIYLMDRRGDSEDSYWYATPTRDYTLEKTVPYGFLYRVESPNFIFTKAPTTAYRDTLDLHAHQSSWLQCYYDEANCGLYGTVGYRITASLYNGSTLVDEVTTALSELGDNEFKLPIEGFDAEPGTYTLKFKLSQCLTNYYDIVDTQGNAVAYTVNLYAPDLLPEVSRILNGSDNYNFTANTAELHYGETAKLKYALVNPYEETFNGTIKVMENYTKATPSIVSEEKQLTIAGNSSERAYGEIEVTVPSDYGYSHNTFRLYAKSQYDTDYRPISNTYLTCAISQGSGIDDITADSDYTIKNGVITTQWAIDNVAAYNISGCAVNSYSVSGNSVDISRLPQGVYVLYITTGGKSLKIKVTK